MVVIDLMHTFIEELNDINECPKLLSVLTAFLIISTPLPLATMAKNKN